MDKNCGGILIIVRVNYDAFCAVAHCRGSLRSRTHSADCRKIPGCFGHSTAIFLSAVSFAGITIFFDPVSSPGLLPSHPGPAWSIGSTGEGPLGGGCVQGKDRVSGWQQKITFSCSRQLPTAHIPSPNFAGSRWPHAGLLGEISARPCGHGRGFQHNIPVGNRNLTGFAARTVRRWSA